MPGSAGEKVIQGPTMAARGPSFSVFPYGGAGGEGVGRGPASESSRTRGRNRSAGSSGPSSREHSLEGRNDGRREGMESRRKSGDFSASHHGHYHLTPAGESESMSWRGDGLASISAGRTGAPNWAVEGEGGRHKADGHWRSGRGVDQGRVQGVVYHDSKELSPREYTVDFGDHGRGDEGRRESRDSNGMSRDHRKENHYGVSSTQRQENGDHDFGGYEGRWGRSAPPQGLDGTSRFPRESLSERDGFWALPGSEASKEAAFGDGRELDTFGSPGGLRRTAKPAGASFLAPKLEPKSRHGRRIDASTLRNNSGEGFAKGVFRRGFGNDDVDGTEVFSGGNRRRQSEDSSQTIVAKIRPDLNETSHQIGGYGDVRAPKNGRLQNTQSGDRGARAPTGAGKNPDDVFKRSNISGSPSAVNAMLGANGLEGRHNLPEELPAPSPSSSSNGSLGRKSGRGREQKRQDPAELPVFIPSSNSNPESRWGGSLDDPAPEASAAEFSPKDSALETDEERAGTVSAKERLLSGKGWESASAGMHRTRSTDWYEICLREEEEEELRARSDKKKREEEEEAVPSSAGGPLKGRRPRGGKRRGKGRHESDVFTPESAKPDMRSVERQPWAALRAHSGDAAQGNADPGVTTHSFFTPWNVHQQQPPVPKPPQSGPMPKSLLQQFEQDSLEASDSPVRHENLNLRVSIAGGRQAAGRPKRAVTSADADQDPLWRDTRRTSRDHAKDDARPGATGEAGARRSEWTDASPDRALPPSKEVETKECAAVMQRANGASTNGYRKWKGTTAANDELLPHIVGTCPDMCPARERLQRERLRDLAVFERLGGDLERTSKDIAVKKFCRTVVASELEQSDVRPFPVLWQTQQYLLTLLDDTEFSFDVVHNFLFDRTRAIRQELGMQRIVNRQTVTMLEEIARFHIMSEHDLRELNRKKSKQLDTHLNREQLSKALYDLLNLYISLGGGGGNGGAPFPNEGEFHAYYVLLNLAGHGRLQGEPLSLWFADVPSRVLQSSSMQFARKALRLYRNNNFTAIFRLVRDATFLQACLLEMNFDSIRATALAMLNTAEYKLHPYPLSDLAAQLILEENEVGDLCTFYGLVTGVDDTTQKLCLLPKQGHFAASDKDGRPQHGCPLIESRRAASLCLEVSGFDSAD